MMTFCFLLFLLSEKAQDTEPDSATKIDIYFHFICFAG